MLLKSIKFCVLIPKVQPRMGINAMKDTEETELDIDIDDIGTILKSSRLKSKKSLEDISSELCIRKIYLTALEEGDYETLPPIPYGVGYVRTYARYLGLNPERAVKLYKDASIVEENTKIEEITEEPEANKSNKWHIIIGVLALVFVYGIWNLSKKDNTENIVFVQDETAMIQEAVSSEVENIISQEKSDALDSPVIEETKKEIAKDVVTDKKEEIAPKSKPENDTTVVADKDKIVIEVTGETWIELKDKNKVYLQGVFHKGDKKTVNYAKNMFITVGRPQNIKISVKGVLKNIVAKNRKSNIPVDSLN